MTYEHLMREHDRIDVLAARLDVMLDVDRPDAEAAMATLGMLVSELDGHLATEDSAIYPRLIVSDDAAAAATAERFVGEVAPLKRDWRQFLDHWSAPAAARDWPRFCGEARAMMARLRARVRAETEVLYPLALQKSIIRLRA